MADCVYCGRDAGAYDEHEECVEVAAEEGLAEAELEEAGGFRPPPRATVRTT